MKKAALSTINASTGNLPRGARRPFRVVEGHPECAVKDADGHTPYITSPAVAHMTATATNAYAKLCGDLAAYETSMRALRLKLRSLPRTPTIADLLAIVDVALCESDEFEEADDL